MSKLKLHYDVTKTRKINKFIDKREHEKNEFQLMPLYGRANLIVSTYRIDVHKMKDMENYKIYFYNEANKTDKILEVIDNVAYDPNYNEKEDNRQKIDIYNSAWLRAYVLDIDDRGMPITEWIPISKSCKIRLHLKIELQEDGMQKTKLLWFCKTKINGKWKWTGNKVEQKKRTPTEKCNIARYLFGEKGVTTKALKIMLGYKDVTQLNRCVRDLRKGKNKCELKNSST